MERDLFDLFAARFGTVNKSLQKVIHREMDVYGLGSAHTICLRQLHKHADGLTQNELSKYCCVDKAQISRVINDLVAKDYVEIGEGAKAYNRRFHLSENGADIAAKINGRIDALLEFVCSKLSEEEISGFFETLDKLDAKFSLLLKDPQDTDQNKEKRNKIMRDYVIVTDSSADLSTDMAEKLGVYTVQLGVVIDGQDPVPNGELDIRDTYRKLREKRSLTTSAASIDQFLTFFGAILEEQDVDILYLGFSSGLSGTFGAGAVALRELQEKYPDRKLYAVDTLCASLGEGLLVYHACQKKAEGGDIDTVRDWVENNKLHLCHWFTVDDLFFLKRGGRVSAATAVVGTMLSIKPVLHVDNAGKLINVSKARGRKASIDAMFAKIEETAYDPKNATFFISHGDCIEDAEYLAGKIRETYGRDTYINYVGPVIGAHSGPGTLALFFLGTER